MILIIEPLMKKNINNTQKNNENEKINYCINYWNTSFNNCEGSNSKNPTQTQAKVEK